MKVLHCMSSGQDSTLSLYNLLKNTDHEVVAGYWRYTHFFSKNHLDFCQKYVYNIVDWLRTNVRDFQFRVERAPSPTWSFFLPPEHRIYDDVVTKEILEKYWNDELHNVSDDMGVLGDKGVAWIIERVYGHYYWMNEINKHSRDKIDYVQTGNDRIQVYYGLNKLSTSLWKDITNVPIVYPLADEKMGRVAIYDAIPDGLKNVMNQCDDTERDGENWCGSCVRCLTKLVHESGMSVEETEKIFDENVEKYMGVITDNLSDVKSTRDFYMQTLLKMLKMQRKRNRKELSFDDTTTAL